MALIVQKFGGTSVADADRIHRAARRAIMSKEKGNQVCVVVSAMGHTTDNLIDLAKQVCSHAGCESSVRRCAIFECIQEKPETCAGTFGRHPESFEV